MTTYTINTENNITAFGSGKDAEAAAQGESFTTQQELTDLATNWPATRLVEVWNGIPGLTPVKKFTDRKSAIARIWNAIQTLDGGSSAEAPKPTKTAATAAPKPANKGKHAAKAKPTKAAKGKPAKPSKTGRNTGTTAAVTRDGSKKATVLGLIQRKNGATLAEIMKATGWQAHSVRGFITGALGKKMGLTVESTKRQDGERVYTIAS
jgi:hypothetical protein